MLRRTPLLLAAVLILSVGTVPSLFAQPSSPLTSVDTSLKVKVSIFCGNKGPFNFFYHMRIMMSHRLD